MGLSENTMNYQNDPDPKTLEKEAALRFQVKQLKRILQAKEDELCSLRKSYESLSQSYDDLEEELEVAEENLQMKLDQLTKENANLRCVLRHQRERLGCENEWLRMKLEINTHEQNLLMAQE